jgi:chloramphenicol-sensitive protein RarD
VTILAVPAALVLAWLARSHQLVFYHQSVRLDVLLIGTGLVTVVPLLLFAAGAQGAPLSAIGMLQYVSPTLQFLVGYYIAHEPLSTSRLVGFIAIWIGVLLYLYTNVKTAITRRGAGAQHG